MIIVTGAAGFIGSCLLRRLNDEGRKDIVIADDLYVLGIKEKNLETKEISLKLDKKELLNWFRAHHAEIDFVYHLGACTDTTETDKNVFDELNLNYSQMLWKLCAEFGIPLVYASSAATYGSGEQGYSDNHELIKNLMPLNLYGHSKNDFDKWALAQEIKPPFWAGLKFFNVYGPNEYHKGKMASMVFQSFLQIQASGKVRLFKSHRPDYKDGEQLRDFIYVKDIVEVCCFLMHPQLPSGIYNLGSGKARTFLDLVQATFAGLNLEPQIEFIDIPTDIQNKYQYFTEAKMTKLRSIGYGKPFFSLEEGVSDYVQNYLVKKCYY